MLIIETAELAQRQKAVLFIVLNHAVLGFGLRTDEIDFDLSSEERNN